MPDLDYAYMPMYGTEPYLDNGGLGGATITQDNLVITAWQVTDKFSPPPNYLDFGYILKPASVNTALPAGDRVAGTQSFNSRHSAYAYINPNTGGNVSPISVVGFVLNPPPELKQLLQGAVAYNGGDPLDIESYTISKSLQAVYAWRNLFNESTTHNLQNTNNDDVFLSMFSSYLFYSEPATESITRIPFLKTSGADGVAPVFFDASISSGVNQMIEAVNDGDFFIAYSIFLEAAAPGKYCGVVYPHSTARG